MKVDDLKFIPYHDKRNDSNSPILSKIVLIHVELSGGHVSYKTV